MAYLFLDAIIVQNESAAEKQKEEDTKLREFMRAEDGIVRTGEGKALSKTSNAPAAAPSSSSVYYPKAEALGMMKVSELFLGWHC